MKQVERTIYEADDGTIFETEDACKKYEIDLAARAKRTTYWRITCKPDLTEGRGWYGLILVECYGPEYNAQVMMLDWCFRTYGRPVAFVQGCSPMDNWILSPVITRDQFVAEGQAARVGDYSYPATRISLVVGGGDTGLQEKK